MEKTERGVSSPADRRALFGKAAASFEFDRDAPVTHQTFTHVIADFVRHVLRTGVVGETRTSTVAQASAEAVAILEEGYQGPHGPGL